MEKTRLAAASFEKQKYFFMPEFSEIPHEIQEEIRVLCVLTAQKLGCTFLIGFEGTGDIYFEVIQPENAVDFDEIGAELEVKEIRRSRKELLNALKLWFVLFRTEDGKKAAQQLLDESEK